MIFMTWFKKYTIFNNFLNIFIYKFSYMYKFCLIYFAYHKKKFVNKP